MTVEPGPVKAYIACSWFTPEQREQLDAGVKAIEANPTVSREFSHFPLELTSRSDFPFRKEVRPLRDDQVDRMEVKCV